MRVSLVFIINFIFRISTRDISLYLLALRMIKKDEMEDIAELLWEQASHQLGVVLERSAGPSLNLLTDLLLDADDLVRGLLKPHVGKVVCESLILLLPVIFPFIYQTITTVYHYHEKSGKTTTATSSKWRVHVATAAHVRIQLYCKIKAGVTVP